jgi:hypothetical protein
MKPLSKKEIYERMKELRNVRKLYTLEEIELGIWERDF